VTTPPPPISYEEITGDYLSKLVGGNARVILEIGAHHGWHTEAFLRLFPNAVIYAFEPDPRAIGIFRARISNPRAHLFEMAISAMDGEAEFHVSSGLPPELSSTDAALYPQGWDQSGSLRAPKNHMAKWPWCKFDRTITVAVRSLDSWAQEHGIGLVDFIWADLQGAEGDLISGGLKTLAQTRYLYTEYSDDEIYEGEPTLQVLLDMLPNFSVLKRYPGDVLLKNKAIGELGQPNPYVQGEILRHNRPKQVPEIQPGKQPPPKQPGRNEQCPCGSGKKYKHCCGSYQ
jgi:FkbM family methyltransferase